MIQQPTTIWINQKPITLTPAQLIQAGGEGMVFKVNNTAVKLYHTPTSQQANKLTHWHKATPLPPHILTPCALVQDAKQQTIGYQMPLLPPHSHPFKRLSQPPFWPKQGITTLTTLTCLHHAHTSLTQLHQQGYIVGDLNDRNLFFGLKPAQSWWIDVDSYQYGRFPCPVAQQDFLDPHLYHVTDFSQKPTFTPLTDWYAFTVLLVKSLLQIHPYGGSHHQHKSLTARAQAQISILNSNVKRPASARPPESLSDDLLHHLHRLFDSGERHPLPLHLITDYANNLRHCPHCHLSYTSQRRHCPRCTHHTPTPTTTIQHKTLLKVDGFIEQIAIRPTGRILAVIRHAHQYHLHRLGIGGHHQQTPLFTGQPGYRCAFFADQLVVNPPHKPQLLLLNISGLQPQQTTLLETAAFQNEATFATTPTHLYRIAQGWIMRGQVQNGHYVEDAIATAHRHQTQLVGSPYNNHIAGYHRIFAQIHYFLINSRGHQYDLDLPTLAQGESVLETAVVFSHHHLAIMRLINQQGHLYRHSHIFTLTGTLCYQHQETAETATLHPHHFPYTTNILHPQPPFHHIPNAPRSHTYLHQHPQGTLTQTTTQLQFTPLQSFAPNLNPHPKTNLGKTNKMNLHNGAQ